MYWLTFFVCLSYAPVCVQVNILPGYRTLNACTDAAIKLEDNTYRNVVEALVAQGFYIEGHVTIEGSCLLKV